MYVEIIGMVRVRADIGMEGFHSYVMMVLPFYNRHIYCVTVYKYLYNNDKSINYDTLCNVISLFFFYLSFM